RRPSCRRSTMGALQEDGIGQSGLAAGEAASDCKGREGERIESMAAVGAGFLLRFLILWWVLRDGAGRNVTVPDHPGVLVALIAVIGLPFYLVSATECYPRTSSERVG